MFKPDKDASFYELEVTGRVPGTNLPYFGGSSPVVIDVVAQVTVVKVNDITGCDDASFVSDPDEGFGDYPLGTTYTPRSTTPHSHSDFEC